MNEAQVADVFQPEMHELSTQNPKCLASKAAAFTTVITPSRRVKNFNSVVHFISLAKSLLTFRKYVSNRGNDNFIQKRKLYQNSSVMLTKEIGEKTIWTEKEIKNQQNLLINAAIKIFRP